MYKSLIANGRVSENKTQVLGNGLKLLGIKAPEEM